MSKIDTLRQTAEAKIATLRAELTRLAAEETVWLEVLSQLEGAEPKVEHVGEISTQESKNKKFKRDGTRLPEFQSWLVSLPNWKKYGAMSTSQIFNFISTGSKIKLAGDHSVYQRNSLTKLLRNLETAGVIIRISGSRTNVMWRLVDAPAPEAKEQNAAQLVPTKTQAPKE